MSTLVRVCLPSAMSMTDIRKQKIFRFSWLRLAARAVLAVVVPTVTIEDDGPGAMCMGAAVGVGKESELTC